MDTFFTSYLYRKYQDGKKKESFVEVDSTVSSGSIAAIILPILLGIVAVFLSWSCNSQSNMGTGLKIVYAVFAFLFGGLYLIFYLLFRAGRCAPQQIIVYAQGPPPVGAPIAQPIQQGGRRVKSYKH